MFDDILDVNKPLPKKTQEVRVVKLDTSKFKKTKSEPVDFGFDLDPHDNVVIEKETCYDPNVYGLNVTDLNLYCAAVFGGPLY